MLPPDSELDGDSVKQKANAHLEQALKSEQADIKNYHIRTVQQLQIVAQERR